MSNTDSFIDEVSEEVRKDQLYGYLKKYGWIAVLLVASIVGASIYSEWSKSKSLSESQARGDVLFSILNEQGKTAQINAINNLKGDFKTDTFFIDLQKAALLADNGKLDAALVVLDKISNSTTVLKTYRDLAALKAVILRGNSLPAEKRLLVLDALAVAGAPFRSIALEQKAIVLIDMNKNAAAIDLLHDILLEPGISNTMHDRIRNTIIVLGGELDKDAQSASLG